MHTKVTREQFRKTKTFHKDNKIIKIYSLQLSNDYTFSQLKIVVQN